MLARLGQRERFTGRDALIFATPTGEHIDPSTLRTRYAAARDLAAQDDPELPRITFHGLRHCFGSRCAASGIDVVSIQRWMGHASIRRRSATCITPRARTMHGGCRGLSAIVRPSSRSPAGSPSRTPEGTALSPEPPVEESGHAENETAASRGEDASREVEPGSWSVCVGYGAARRPCRRVAREGRANVRSPTRSSHRPRVSGVGLRQLELSPHGSLADLPKNVSEPDQPVS